MRLQVSVDVLGFHEKLETWMNTHGENNSHISPKTEQNKSLFFCEYTNSEEPGQFVSQKNGKTFSSFTHCETIIIDEVR